MFDLGWRLHEKFVMVQKEFDNHEMRCKNFVYFVNKYVYDAHIFGSKSNILETKHYFFNGTKFSTVHFCTH